MIRYDLRCDKGHEFDGWFSDSASFDAQLAKKLVTCAHCGSTNVDKQLMAPGIPAKGNRNPAAKMAGGVIDPEAQRMLALMRELRRQVETNAEYVGGKFADEARKIHYEEAEKRGIYGEASHDDARALLEEGIEVHPLPRLPEDAN
jgi:hypothetical protein